MKVVIVGGGAPSTPALFEFLALQRRLPRLHFVLLGPTATTLTAVTRAGCLVDPTGRVSIEPVVTTDACWPRCITDADVVLLQARVGGYAGRAADELTPVKYGIAGDSTIGPGGASAAWRGWPELRPYVDEISRRAPGAVVVVMSSPVGILVRLARRTAPQLNVMGVCELPAATLRDICRKVRVRGKAVSYGYAGVNHLGWFYHLRCEGHDLLPSYVRLAASATCAFPDPSCLVTHGAIPTGHWWYLFRREQALAKQRNTGHERTEALAEFRRAALDAYERGRLTTIRRVLHQRAAPWYPQAVGPLILGLAGLPIGETLFLTTCDAVLNRGLGLGAKDVLEAPYRFRRGRLCRIRHRGSIPSPVATLIAAQVRFERGIAAAIERSDRARFARAIAVSPWKPAEECLEPMVSELLDGTFAGSNGVHTVSRPDHRRHSRVG